MPWMIFYQQSAVVDKGLTVREMPLARLDTALGALLTQAIMCAVVVTSAATLFANRIPASDAAHAALAFQPLVGRFAGAAFGAALIGASLLGAFIVTLATAWAFAETLGWRCSLNDGRRARGFIAFYLGCVVLAAGITLIPHLPLIRVTLYVEAFNGFVLPLVLGFLLILVNDRRVIGRWRNGLFSNVLTFALSVVIVGLGLWMIGISII